MINKKKAIKLGSDKYKGMTAYMEKSSEKDAVIPLYLSLPLLIPCFSCATSPSLPAWKRGGEVAQEKRKKGERNK